MIQFSALVVKELKEAFRDKRGLMAAFLLAVMAPVFLYAVSQMAIDEAVERPPVFINIAGEHQAPKLVHALKMANIQTLAAVPPEGAGLWTKRDITLIIPDDFGDGIRRGNTVEVLLRADFSDQDIRGYLRRIDQVVNGYAHEIGIKRLMMRGIDGQLLQPVKLTEQDTALPGSNAGFITKMLVMYLLMAAFMSGMAVAIDSSAGERERNVLEVLLCQPVSTHKIVLAKLAGASVVAMLGVLLTLVFSLIAIDFVDLSQIGLSFELEILRVLGLLAALLPICVFSAALQLFVAFQAKSFKEAQSMVSMIIMLPVMLPFALNFIKDKPLWIDWMPIVGQNQLMESLLKGSDVGYGIMAGTAVMTLAASALLVQILSVRLKSEKVVLALG